MWLQACICGTVVTHTFPCISMFGETTNILSPPKEQPCLGIPCRWSLWHGTRDRKKSWQKSFLQAQGEMLVLAKPELGFRTECLESISCCICCSQLESIFRSGTACSASLQGEKTADRDVRRLGSVSGSIDDDMKGHGSALADSDMQLFLHRASSGVFCYVLLVKRSVNPASRSQSLRLFRHRPINHGEDGCWPRGRGC